MVSDEIFTFSTYYAQILKKEIKADDSITDQFCQIAGKSSSADWGFKAQGSISKAHYFLTDIDIVS